MLIQRLERQLTGQLSAIDVIGLPPKERQAISLMRHEVFNARLDIRDYELSETRAEQLTNARQARQRLKQVVSGMLAASEYNVFSPADVALFSAQLEQISSKLK